MLRVVYAIVRLGYARKIISRAFALCWHLFGFTRWIFFRFPGFFEYQTAQIAVIFCQKDCKRDVSRSRYDPEEFQHFPRYSLTQPSTAIFSVGRLIQIFCGHISLLSLCKISNDKSGSYSKPYHFDRSFSLLWKGKRNSFSRTN